MNFLYKSIEDLKYANIIVENNFFSILKIFYTKSGRVHLSVRMLSSNFFLRFFAKFYLKSFNIEILTNSFNGRIFFPHPQNIIIGSNILFSGNIVICQGVTIGGNFKKKLKDLSYPIFGNNVWIGPNSVVGGPVRISDNVLIGANSVVTKNIPKNSLVFGQNQVSKNKIKFNFNMTSYEKL